VEALRSFLGLATYFRKFCENFSSIAQPLHRLTRKDVNWAWSAECQKAFDTLKQKLSVAPVLAMPDLSPDAAPFEIICDASNVGLGAILVQNGHPVAFESRKLLPAEQNYHPGELELLAVVHAMRTWRCYLEGMKVTVVTDHNPLTYLPSQPNLSRRQARWSEFLQNFDLSWQYRPGASNPADPLSRVRLDVPAQAVGLLLLAISGVEVTKEQGKGRARRPLDLRDRCRAGYSADSWFAERVEELKEQLGADGLYRDKARAILVPNVDTLRRDILQEVHDSPYGGHLGAARTLEQLRRLFIWPKVHEDVEQYVRTCHVCQRDKALHTGPRGLMQSLET
jgi:hypothetical protein